jgi:hypothetical protein
MFEFFRMWLLVVSIGMVVGSATMVLLAGTPLLSGLNRSVDAAFWPAAPEAGTRKFQTWSYSVTFATMAGWGLLVVMIVANAFASRQAWAWWSIAGSLALWFPLDTGRSLYHRVYANVALNSLLLVILAIPLIGTFGEFR